MERRRRERGRIKTHAFRGSHLPVLMKLVNTTNGPILELGCGFYSSIYLHWACFSTKRKLVTCENNPEYFDFINQFKTDYHAINCVENFGPIYGREQWGIAFVDHSPEGNRTESIRNLVHSDFVVAHDTEDRRGSVRRYNYASIYDLFKYRYRYDVTWPNTTVFSNKYDVTNFKV